VVRAHGSKLNDALALAALVRAGEASARELTDEAIRRVEASNPELNFLVTECFERARETVPADGPFAGVPMLVKDLTETAGVRTTFSSRAFADYVPAHDAAVVRRLKGVGFVVLGKSNTPEFGITCVTESELNGACRNPWDTGRTPGGSSGGAAAAVAAGFTPLELGSDIGGSIRCPAHFCGVYGHKPSYGMVPLRGHIPPDPGELLAPPLGVAGPLARSAADLELALDVLAPAPPPHSRHERLDGFRVALWADGEGYSVDARCLEAMHGYAEDLRRLGVTVDEAARPEIDLRDSDDLYVAMLFATVSAGMPEELLAQTEAAGAGADPGGYPARIAKAVRLTHHEFVALQERQLQLQQAWRRFFEDVDLILCPVMPTVAFPHDHSGDGPGHIAQYTRTTIVDGRPVPYMNGLQWPGLVTVANLPATALPTGRLIDGLPMGIQAVGPFGEDRTPLRFAALAEREIAGFRAPPL
jgi:amidase